MLMGWKHTLDMHREVQKSGEYSLMRVGLFQFGRPGRRLMKELQAMDKEKRDNCGGKRKSK